MKDVRLKLKLTIDRRWLILLLGGVILHKFVMIPGVLKRTVLQQKHAQSEEAVGLGLGQTIFAGCLLVIIP